MNQEIFWTISSINFLCIIILTFANIVVSRKTSLQIRYLTQLNSIDQKQHDKLIAQFAEFLSAIDENKITLPTTKLDSVVRNEAEREATLSELRNYSSKAEIAYYQLLLISQYSKTDFSFVEGQINAIMEQYRLMLHNLISGLIEHIQYFEVDPKYRSSFEFFMQNSANHLADHARIRESFGEQKACLMEIVRQFVDKEIEAISKTV